MPEIHLRLYQVKALNELRASIAKFKRSILVMPTGSGKTTVAGFMAKESTLRKKRLLFIAHRTEVLTQARTRFQQLGLTCGIIQGQKSIIEPYLNVASVQTVRNRLSFMRPYDIIVIDECHLSMASSYRKVLDHFPNAFVVGLTATPRRLDGKPLGEIYKDLVNPISIKDLVESGNLVPAKYSEAVSSADLTGVATIAGEFSQSELFSRFDKPTLYSGVIDHYKLKANGTSFICFCVNIEHSKKTAEAFNQAGISCVHIDGELPTNERKRLTDLFRSGAVMGVCNVNLFTEGFDVPHVQTCIINRATQSEALFMQMIGRCLRPYHGKFNAIVLDHGRNVTERHGFHDDDKEWSLTEKAKKKSNKLGAFGVETCSQCQYMMPPSVRFCPECGHTDYQPIENKTTEAEIFRDISAIDRPKRPEHLRKKYTEMNESELRQVQQLLGYKDGWVYAMLKVKRKYQNK